MKERKYVGSGRSCHEGTDISRCDERVVPTNGFVELGKVVNDLGPNCVEKIILSLPVEATDGPKLTKPLVTSADIDKKMGDDEGCKPKALGRRPFC